MARKELTQFQRARLSRRLGGIDQLATQYQKNIQQITGEYQTAFSDYQAEVAKQMAPYEAELGNFQNVVMPEYEAAMGRYKAKLDAYNQQLQAIAADPVIERQGSQWTSKDWRGRRKRIDYVYYEAKPIPELTALPPFLAKEAPTPPQIAEFDSSEFDAKRAQTQTTYKREVSERRGARMSAVSRRSARPLMQGA